MMKCDSKETPFLTSHSVVLLSIIPTAGPSDRWFRRAKRQECSFAPCLHVHPTNIYSLSICCQAGALGIQQCGRQV